MGESLMKKLIAVFVLFLLLSACSTNAGQTNTTPGNGGTTTNTGQNQSTDAAKPTPTASDKVNDGGPEQAATPQDAAAAVILALKEDDMATLAAYIHPNKGLLFSPYAHIDTATAKVFPATGLPALTDTTVYQWGSYDGSGEPIALTFQQYYDKFVYDRDFINPETVGEDQIIGTGNTIVNIKDVYPESYVMDYYFSGFDPQYEGMDWESLILVLEELNGAWYVSAIVHSQWTI
jgi:hypothetical protein